MRENRETPRASGSGGPDRLEKATSYKTSTHASGESDEQGVPAKRSNKGEQSSAEGVEGSCSTKGNTEEAHTRRRQGRERVSQGLGGVREAALRDKKQQFTALLHHVTVDLLGDSYHALKKRAAPGVDGVTGEQYGEGVEERLQDLHDRIHRGAYRAQPSRRTYIPKADGRQRPLGNAALEDKIVQQAVVTVLNTIYEEDFLGFSDGFRPGRSQHDALDALTVGLRRRKVGWVLDLDVRGFFDNVAHEWLGFTHICGKTRKGNWFKVKRQTVKKRLRSKLQAVRQELRKRWHERVDETGDWLRSVVQGYFNYHAVPGNFGALQTFRREVVRAWLAALRHRSQRHRLPWERFRSIIDRYLPLPRILHPEPGVRFDAKYPR